MRIYRGTHGHDVELLEDTDEGRARGWSKLSPRFDLRNHSPTGFSWGYGGSGPAQLALALLADATGDDARALASYQSFKRRVIAALDMRAPWQLSRAEILFSLETIEEGYREGELERRVSYIRDDLEDRLPREEFSDDVADPIEADDPELGAGDPNEREA